MSKVRNVLTCESSESKNLAINECKLTQFKNTVHPTHCQKLENLIIPTLGEGMKKQVNFHILLVGR